MRITKLLLAVFATYAVLASAQQEDALQPGVSGLPVEEVDKLYASEKHVVFQTEVSRLMNLIINSLYKTREIFLRELISNASDALDKIRFMSLTDSNALASNGHFNISIVADKPSKTLVITDSGVGMTAEQLRANLGTIAKSGTSEFLSHLESEKNKGEQMNLIGQFGVGFYSAFLVADKVTVASKSNDDPDQHVWISEAVDDFVIAKDPRGNTLGRGTQITLHLKDDALEYLEEENLKALTKKYSEFINFPIYLWSTNFKWVENKSDAAEISEEANVKDDTEAAEKEPKREKVEVKEWELLNTQNPIWTRDPKEVTENEYMDFYKTLDKEPEAKPIIWSHFKGEGDVDFKAIIYVPERAPRNYYHQLQDIPHRIKLFVRRVFITDELGADFIPRWLSFISAVVDADDLPLNVSRETLQKHKLLNLISKRIVKKALDLFAHMAKTDEEKYAKFIREFSMSLKLGAIESSQYRKKITQLLRYPSSLEKEGSRVSLDAYVSRMKSGQNSIFYSTGTSVEEIEQSPFLERLLARGYEVLYMTEPIDEMLIQALPGYNGKAFANIAKGDLKFGDEDESEGETLKKLNEQYQPLTDWLKNTLDEHVEKVAVSKRLTTSPMAIVASAFGWTGHTERLMQAQAANPGAKDDFMFQMMMKQKKNLEINPDHPVIQTLLSRIEDGEIDEETKEVVTVLYETTAIRSGYTLKDVNNFTKRVESIVRKRLDVDLNKQADYKVEMAKDKTPEEIKEDEEKASSFADDASEEDDLDDTRAAHDEL
ncbi:hypothetical protein BZG36_01337 [Bifiguratus adelaidae]|uniref:Histidine kinase/HSP90-like ATPase domain-containing protein n=1 Tax=Bifiguratus adelaidae TaxID=1938954 RepID=A0A261Y529_9FUNG|nr:hypothetical protein BZG36_01337 [Bifiguratus adelaidae]